jgi:hypothetical protein
MLKKVVGVVSLVVLTSGWFGVTATPAVAETNAFTVDASETAANGKLYSIDLTSGTTTEIGQTGQNDIEGLTFACDGTLFGVNRAARGENVANDQPAQLVTINTTTGTATVVGALGVPPADAGLTVGTDGKLYMAEVNNGRFYEVNKTTAAVTDIGLMGDGVEISGLATRADGTIFGYDRQNTQLVTIDTTTGSASAVGPAGDHNLVGLDFDAAGVLWGISGNGEIVTFDTATGTDTPVTNYDPDEHQFVSLALGPQRCAPPTTTSTAPSTTAASSASSTPASSSTAATSDSSSSLPIVLIAIAVAAVIAVLIVVAVRRRRTDEPGPQ